LFRGSLGSRVNYRIRLADGRLIFGTGYAHLEKNWGRNFPEFWLWSQGISQKNKRQFVLAGGDIGIGSDGSTGWILGYRSNNKLSTFNPFTKNVRFVTRIDACSGVFDLLALSEKTNIYVSARTEPRTFSKVMAPDTTGLFVPLAKESFSSTVRIEVFSRRHRNEALKRFNNLQSTSSQKALESTIFDQAAFEYGGTYNGCSINAKGR